MNGYGVKYYYIMIGQGNIIWYLINCNISCVIHYIGRNIRISWYTDIVYSNEIGGKNVINNYPIYRSFVLDYRI